MSLDARQYVDVRFFGAHDRAWVPATHCMLFSEKDPNKMKGSAPTNNKNASKNQKGIADAMKEKDDYIENLRHKYGFKYSPVRTLFDPNNLQGQLEYMLPGLKDPKEDQNGVEKEFDGAQKEKLTLKIIKGQSSNYQVEQKTAEQRTTTPIHKPSEKDKPKLYKVLSKNDDNTDLEQSGKLYPLIIKRKSNVEQETEKVKKTKTSDNASETSESNASVQSVKGNSRRKSMRDSSKHKRLSRNAEKDSPPEPPTKKAKHSEKQKTATDDTEEHQPKTSRRPRAKSVMPESDKPLLVPLIAPPGTDEIQTLREEKSVELPATNKRTQKRSRSFNRSRSTEVEATSKTLPRRLSINVATSPKKSVSEAVRKNSYIESTPKPSVSEVKKDEEINFDPNIRIKNEPVSDSEEIEQRDAFTLSDIPNLINQNKTGKKKLIVISTNEGSEASATSDKAKARKTFPNNPNSNQLEAFASQPTQVRHGDWMVCIPQTFSAQASSSGIQSGNMNSPPTSNRSTPASDSTISLMRNNLSTSRRTSNVTPAITNLSSSRSFNMNVVVPPLSYNISNSNISQRRNSTQMNPVVVNGQRISTTSTTSPNFPQQRNHQPEPPRLIPRPQGVFVNDGSTFNRDVGPVSRLLTDNAHRMSDFFRTVLIDTVTSFAPEVPAAENLMLRAENEKLHREMQTTKAECQQKMQELRREHQEEIETIRKECGELMI